MSVQSAYGLSVVDIDLPTLSILILAKSATRIVCVQRITFTPTVYSGTTITFVDSVTLKSIGRLDVPLVPPSATDNGSHGMYLDWGPTGTKLSIGANLIIGGNGNGRLHIEAYQKGR